MEELITVGTLALSALVLTTIIVFISAWIEPRQPSALEVAADDERRRH